MQPGYLPSQANSLPSEPRDKPQRYKGDLKSFWQSIKTQKILKCYLFQLIFPYVITFKKAALYLKNISLTGWNWRILPKKRKTRRWSSRPRNAMNITIVSMRSTLIRDFLEAMSKIFQKSPEGKRFPCFSKSLFHDQTCSPREETELVSGKRTPTGLRNPSEHHLPPPPRSVPLASWLSAQWVLSGYC